MEPTGSESPMGGPGAAGIVRAPDAAVDGAEIEAVAVLGVSGDGEDAAAADRGRWSARRGAGAGRGGWWRRWRWWRGGGLRGRCGWAWGFVLREAFFFEKKNQKNFCPAVEDSLDKSFLVLFSKKDCFLPYPPGNRSKATLRRAPGDVNGTVPCHIYEGNSTSIPGSGLMRCSGGVAAAWECRVRRT